MGFNMKELGLSKLILLAFVINGHCVSCSDSTSRPSGDLSNTKYSTRNPLNATVTAHSLILARALHQAHQHSRVRRQLFDGFRLSDLFPKPDLGALENVDSVLRSTRNIDVFQCLERVSCEMAAPLRNAGQSPPANPLAAATPQIDAATIAALQAQQQQQQQLLNQQLQQQILQQGFQQVPQAQPGLQFAPQQAGFQQVAPQFGSQVAQFPHAGFQQVPQFAPQLPLQSQHPHHLQVGQPIHQFGLTPIRRRHATESSHIPSNRQPPNLHHSQKGYPPQHSNVQRNYDSKRHNQHATHHQGSIHENQRPQYYYQGYQENRERPNENEHWFNRLVKNFKKLGRRKREAPNHDDVAKLIKRSKRGVVDVLKKLWGGKEMVGVLDRMMEGTDDSIYPYTRAALMGYTGSTETCDQLYPHCPTTMDELIDTFNNLRSYFPNGVPFRDRLPAPIRYLIP